MPQYCVSPRALSASAGAGTASGGSGSPPLSSPEHALFKGWQAAQAGLASGRAPQLTPASSGGTYFCRGSDGAKVAVLKPADEVCTVGCSATQCQHCCLLSSGVQACCREGHGYSVRSKNQTCNLRRLLSAQMGAPGLEVPQMQNCGCSRDPLRACGPREVRTPHCALEAGHKRFGVVVLCEALQ